MALITMSEDAAAVPAAPPTVGQIVHYRLSSGDVEQINDRRVPGVAQSGNRVAVGDICAAVLVRTFGGQAVNLKVLLDGDDSYWATSRCGGDADGQWSWPPRV